MSYKAVIFDWDGTVVDSVDHITDCLHLAATGMGLESLERSAYRNIIGLGLVEALNQLYPGISEQQMLTMRESYSRHFFTRQASPKQIFAGMQALLHELRHTGRGRSVATGKSRRGLDSALTGSGLTDYFDITRCADESRSKPDPTMLREILAFYDIAPHEAIMIGDTSYDLEMAQRIGMPSIGVQWGVHDTTVLSRFEPVAVVESVSELRQVLGILSPETETPDQ